MSSAADLAGNWTLVSMTQEGEADEKAIAAQAEKIAKMKDFLTRARLTPEELARRKAIIEQESAKLDGMTKGMADAPVPGGVEVTAMFLDGAMAGKSGCNRYKTSIAAGSENAVKIGPVVGTRMLCQGAPMQVEKAYLAILRKVSTAEQKGGQLALSTADGQRLIFKAAAP